MSRHLWILLALPLSAACGGSDGGPGHGSGGDGGGGGPVCTQLECEGNDDYREVARICLPEGCTEVGSHDPYGDVRRGAMLVGLTTEGIDARTVASAYLRVYYPVDAAGDAVDCARIRAAPDGLDARLNVVGYYTTVILSQGYLDFAGPLGPFTALPVNDASTPYLVYAALFSGDRDAITHDPTGVLMAEGCLDGMVVAEGEAANWSEPDAAHLFSGLVATAP